MKARLLFRVAALLAIAWIIGAPFLWRRNLGELFGAAVPWDLSAGALALSLVAVGSVIPLWRLQWRGSLVVLAMSLVIAVFSMLSTSPFAIGTLFNAVLLTIIAGIPVALHSNNELKVRLRNARGLNESVGQHEQ
jgi:hypothetical protein